MLYIVSIGYKSEKYQEVGTLVFKTEVNDYNDAIEKAFIKIGELDKKDEFYNHELNSALEFDDIKNL